MILPFKTHIGNRQTYFVEKILRGRLLADPATDEFIQKNIGNNFGGKYELNRSMLATCKPKIHTLRNDVNQRWAPGMQIHPSINNRSKNMLVFAPAFPCVSTQPIMIMPAFRKVFIGYRSLTDYMIQKLAQNDGFETVELFWEWFNEDFDGKIIHFTDLKY